MIIWDLANNYNKLKTIPFPNPIEGLYLNQSSDLFLAISPSNIFHFDVKDHKVSKHPILSLQENETVTGFHFAPHNFEAVNGLNSCLITTHTGTIYEVIKTKQENHKKPTLEIIHQVISCLYDSDYIIDFANI